MHFLTFPFLIFSFTYIIDYDTEFESLLLLSTHPSPRGVCYSEIFVTVGLNSIICSLCSLVCPFRELFCYKMKLTHALYWHSLFLSFHSPRTRNLKVVCAFENPFTIYTLHQWLDITIECHTVHYGLSPLIKCNIIKWSRLQVFSSKLSNVFVKIANSWCPKCKFHFCKLQIEKSGQSEILYN